MTEQPHVQPLSRLRRNLFFYTLLFMFVLAMPIFIFYATGYRYDFFAENPTITATGGVYISSEAEDTAIYVDEEPVKNLRIFRNAAYIQGLTPGIHRIHVQGEGIHTWVKELPVYPHIVTEVSAFTVPNIPHIRPIMHYVTLTGDQLYRGATTTMPFQTATSTTPLVATSTKTTSNLMLNPEFDYLESLFSTSTATSTNFVSRFIGRVSETFQFSSDVSTSTLIATTSVTRNDMKLIEVKNELYATWRGDQRDIPYYFCIPHLSQATTTAFYGEHVMNGLASVLDARTESDLLQTETESSSVCRTSIRIDNQGKEYYWFAFLPDSSDHVLLLLSDGLYVTEIDDRSWQNSQLLYPGDNLFVVVDGGQIFIKDGNYYAELYTEIQN